MDTFADVYTSIRAKLAYTYWRAELARVPVQDAKIDTTNIAWGMTPLVLWNNILIRAIRERKINNLLDCACRGMIELENLKSRFFAAFAEWDPNILEDERLPFPLNQSFLDIVTAIKDGSLVPVLGPSINPAIYNELAEHLEELVADNPHGSPEQRKEFVKTHYGLPCSICHYHPILRPEKCPLLADLSGNPPCPVYNEQMLSIAKANCRSLSELYVKHTLPVFYNTLTPTIIRASRKRNPIFKALANLLSDWPLTPATREPGRARRVERGPALPFPVIINSNFDAGLELEFDCEPELEQEFGVFEHKKIKYDLVWSLAAGANRGKWRYCPYPYSNQNPVFIGQGWPAQSYPIGAPHGRYSGEDARVIVVKIFGTINDPGTRVSNRLEVGDDFFLITQAQMELFFSRLFQDIDVGLGGVFANVKMLFLGFSPNDSDLRAIVHRLYGGGDIPCQSWIIHQCQVGEVDKEVWNNRGRVQLLQVDTLEQAMVDIERGVRDVS